MKKVMKILGAILFASFLFSSCSTMNKTMREPNVRVDLTKSDFTLSDQVKAEAKSIKIIGIDFSRFFMKKTGSVASLSVIGNLLSDKTANYALYELLNNNPGYDVIFYPQYTAKVFKPVLGIGFLAKITTVETKARLGKLNK